MTEPTQRSAEICGKRTRSEPSSRHTFVAALTSCRTRRLG
jgi:hypothetical protein